MPDRSSPQGTLGPATQKFMEEWARELASELLRDTAYREELRCLFRDALTPRKKVRNGKGETLSPAG